MHIGFLETDPLPDPIERHDLRALIIHFEFHPRDYAILRQMVERCWWEGLRYAIREKRMNPNWLYDGYRLLDVWHELSIEKYWDYTDELDDMDEKHMKWGLTELIDLGCNPYLCDKFQLHEFAYTYYMDKVANKCRRSVLFVLSSKGWMTRDTRFLIAKALWETRGDWEAWESV